MKTIHLAFVLGLLGIGCARSNEGASNDSSNLLSADESIIISQIYVGAGLEGAAYKSNFIELMNRGTKPVSLKDLFIQTAAGDESISKTKNVRKLTKAVVLSPGQHFLIHVAGSPPPPPPPPPEGDAGAQDAPRDPLPSTDVDSDQSFVGNFTLPATGKLVISRTALTNCGGKAPAQPCVGWLDMIGWGEGASQFEGPAAVGALSGTSAALRKEGRCQDTDRNDADFEVAAPAPMNMLSAAVPCEPPKGPQGEQGVPGEAGVPGVDGVPGAQGPQGQQGVPGAQGSPGAQGTPGSAGAAGATGETGPAGERGRDGDDGATGPKGDDGATGNDGPRGVAGPPGASCSAAPGSPVSSSSFLVGIAIAVSTVMRRRRK